MKPLRKRHQERRHFAGGQGPAADSDRVFDVREWREKERHRALVDFGRRTKGLKWSKLLLLLLLEELFIADEFDEIISPPEKVRPNAYPQAVALAIALRHSWWPSDLERIRRQLLERHPGPKRT